MTKEEMFKKLPKMDVGKEEYSILNLTHTDADGYMPVAILKYCFGNSSVDALHFGYGMEDVEKVRDILMDENIWNAYDFVIMTDYSISMDLAEKLQTSEYATKFVLLDHHESGMNLNKYNFACVAKESPTDSFIYDWNKKVNYGRYAAGTSLLVDYLEYVFASNGTYFPWWEIEPLSERITGYDNWDWHRLFEDDSRYQLWTKIFWTIGGDNFVDYVLQKFSDMKNIITTKGVVPIDKQTFQGYFWEGYKPDKDILDAVRKAEKEAFAYAESRMPYSATFHKEFFKKVREIVFVMATQHQRDVFDLLMKKYPNADIYAVMTESTISLRSSKEEIDLSKIAGLYGGGGHKGAAGFPITSDTFRKIGIDVLNVSHA